MMLVLAMLVLAAGAAVAARLWRTLHMLQLEGYRLERYTRHAWERRSWRDAVPALAGALTFAVAALVSLAGAHAPVTVAVLLVAAVAEAAYVAWSVWGRPAKKPLALTARAWRILVTSAVLELVLAAAAALLVARGGVEAAPVALAAYAAGAVLVLVAPAVSVAAVVALEPLEAALRRGFVEKARRRLAEVSPLVIGVAGSYGKTTTKNALVAALSGSYRVMATPESYNTLLGVTRAINEGLADDTEVLVVEMGARQAGDIDEICRLVRPRVGVVTRLGPQHLEYFKTQENVVRTKTELLRALPADGIAVVDADGATDFRDRDWRARTVRVSLRPEGEPEALVGDITLGGDGTSFAVTRADGSDFDATTPLLGRHAAVNCALAAVAALELGVEPEAVRAGLAGMKPVPHRLEIVRNDSVVVIDDAYNSNPEGFSAALEVLGSFPGRRILVTPGMIELGAETVPAHERVAREAARACDAIILVGRTWPPQFVEALTAAGFPAEAVSYAGSLADATTLLGGMIRAGDVVLFENDLPDNFA